MCLMLIPMFGLLYQTKKLRARVSLATPERLLELVSLKAIDISCVSILVSKCGYWKQKIDELHLIVLYLSF